ncbi:MAG TPA: histidine kinase [Candidatus Acidoferrales bacterium]|jgi:two-component system LytT family sensor kinase|nr:histidine kinase [Candidatus Acidoferrales bacterium]
MRMLRLAIAIWAAWTLYAVFTASENYITAYGPMAGWSRAFAYSLADAWPWALLTPVAFLIAGRLLVRRANWWWVLPLLFVCGIAVGTLHLIAFIGLLLRMGYVQSSQMVGSVVRGKFHSEVLTCWTLFGIRHATEYYRRYRVREVAASRLQAQLARAQLEVLRMQLQPHFLFNTLHAISALMYRDVEGADRMVTRLSDFLRLTLDSAGVQEVTLKREMEYLDKYLDIEQVRFGERLQVARSIEPDALDLLVPNLALQPLVENAVRYAVAPRAAGGRVEIAARVAGGSLTIEVQDDGPGAPGGFREGVGLSNTRARLEQLYGVSSHLELGNTPGGGFRARMAIPAHMEPLDASSDRR